MISIAPYRGISLKSEWVEKVIIQLNRDLSLTGYDHEFKVQSNLLDFQEQCIEFFESLLEKNDQQLYNLLYRIDVDQKKIYSGQGKPQLLIAQLVIQREFQKVVLKNQFS